MGVKNAMSGGGEGGGGGPGPGPGRGQSRGRGRGRGRGGGITSGNSVGLGSSNHRPMFGGEYAMAYEAARAVHYRNSEEKQSRKSKIKREGCNNMNMNPMDDMMSGGMGVKNAMSGDGGEGNMMPPFGLSVDPNQHYKILKLHLLLEIQKTNTVMIKLFQLREIRKLQQQQQRIAAGKMGCYAGGGNRMGGLGGGGNQMGSGGNSNFLMGMMNQSQGGGVNMIMGGGGNHTMMVAMAAPQSVQDDRRTSAHLDEFCPVSGSLRRW